MQLSAAVWCRACAWSRRCSCKCTTSWLAPSDHSLGCLDIAAAAIPGCTSHQHLPHPASLLPARLQVLSWGGYSFIINLLPIYCLFCIITGRLNSRMYLAFSPLVVVGTLMSGGSLAGLVLLQWLWWWVCIAVQWWWAPSCRVGAWQGWPGADELRSGGGSGNNGVSAAQWQRSAVQW